MGPFYVMAKLKQTAEAKILMSQGFKIAQHQKCVPYFHTTENTSLPWARVSNEQSTYTYGIARILK